MHELAQTRSDQRVTPEPSRRGLAFRHSRRCTGWPCPGHACLHLRSLCSTPVTGLPCSYGRSDSCSPGSSALASMNAGPCREQVSPIHVHDLLTIPSPHTSRSPGAALPRYPSARRASLRFGLRLYYAGSPATRGRIEFVILRTGRSPPVAPHPVSPRRSYSRFQAGERMLGEDFHLSDRARSRAHVAAGF